MFNAKFFKSNVDFIPTAHGTSHISSAQKPSVARRQAVEDSTLWSRMLQKAKVHSR